jgi:predicted secreted protein
VEVENTVASASAHENVEGFVWKIALPEGKLVEEHQTREVAEQNSCGLSEVVANVERRW